jgi:hypothetical protein
LRLPDDPMIKGLVLYSRRGDSIQWQKVRVLPISTELLIPNLMVDNFVFAIATIDERGNESLPVYPASLIVR